jgi:uncharacterized protein
MAAPRRIASLDILRGFALLGMLIVHFHDHSTEPGGLDDAVRVFVWRFIESKSHGTFALLFGAGFAIQLRRAEQQGRPFAAIYLRRLAVLALFGFAAHAFFGFNVLLGYAVWGVPLMLIRRWSTRALLVTAAVSVLSVTLYALSVNLYVRATSGPEAAAAFFQARRATAVSVNQAVDAAEAHGSYRELLAARLRHMAWFHVQPFFVMPGVTLALFIAGLLFIRHGVIEHPEHHRRLLIGLIVFGVTSWAADNWLLGAIQFDSALGLIRDQWLMFAYVSAALLVMAAYPAIVPRLHVLAGAGRMALTNYLIQIAVIDLLFSAYALGLGRIRPLAGPMLAIALFAVQAAFSTFWLRRFQYGPAEWVWRSLTYGGRQPMRRAAHAQTVREPV